MADEPYKLQTLNPGHEPAHAGSEGKRAPAAPRLSELEHPSSRPSSELRREKDKDGERAAGGQLRPGVPRLQPWRTLGLPSRPESPARAFLLSSSKFSAEAGRAPERRPRAAGQAGGTGCCLQGAPRAPCRARSFIPTALPPQQAPALAVHPSPNTALSSLCTLIPTLLLFLCPHICPLQTVGAGERQESGGGILAATGLSCSVPRAIPDSCCRASPRHKGGDPAPGSLPTLGAAHSPHPGGGGGSRAPLAAPPLLPLPQENAAAGLASCSASCASVPPPPRPRGSVGAETPGLGWRGGGSGSTTTWPPGAGPGRPGSRGSGKGGANHSPPLPPRAAPNSASQVTRPGAAARTCGRCSWPGSGRIPWPARPERPWLAFRFERIMGPFLADLIHHHRHHHHHHHHHHHLNLGNDRCSPGLGRLSSRIVFISGQLPKSWWSKCLLTRIKSVTFSKMIE
ncbi:translation initiation factor IF-2-like [Pteropus medius]|uniref:translation initiation factor IF-2-like n=1 Tax=Pteropus vampyrus TaxID=132908 RepID=UPI00196A3058|nr:translation initiation factor IF-2-like [Pteropus giganteus]